MQDSAQIELSQQRSLARMKQIASGLLLLMTFTFIGSLYGEKTWPWMGWVKAFSEAAMVGALADWFAVVALFRRPLNLPIPHTAIIPENRERIAETMGRFIQSNFLSEEVLPQKIVELNPALRIAEWIKERDNASVAGDYLLEGLRRLLKSDPDPALKELLKKTLLDAFQAVDLSALSSYLLQTALDDRQSERLFKRGIQKIEQMLDDHSGWLRDTLGKELPWYVPSFLHDKVYEHIINGARDTLADINSDPQHPYKLKFFAALEDLIRNLKSSPEYKKKAENLKEWLLKERFSADISVTLLSDLRKLVLADLDRKDSRARAVFTESISSIGSDLTTNRAGQRKINSAIEKMIAGYVRDYSDEVTSFVADTVKRWEPKTLIEKIELQVGRDLQYVRVNGTIVGGLAGVAIYAISKLLI